MPNTIEWRGETLQVPEDDYYFVRAKSCQAWLWKTGRNMSEEKEDLLEAMNDTVKRGLIAARAYWYFCQQADKANQHMQRAFNCNNKEDQIEQESLIRYCLLAAVAWAKVAEMEV